MTLPASWPTPLRCVSNELFADAIIKPNTKAVIVPISPMPSLTTSLDSLVRCCSGKTARSSIPSSVPPKTQAKMMPLMPRLLIFKSFLSLTIAYDETFFTGGKWPT